MQATALFPVEEADIYQAMRRMLTQYGDVKVILPVVHWESFSEVMRVHHTPDGLWHSTRVALREASDALGLDIKYSMTKECLQDILDVATVISAKTAQEG